MDDCLVCGLPSEAEGWPFGMPGVGFNGQDIVLWMQRYRCPAGHWYQIEVGEEQRDHR